MISQIKLSKRLQYIADKISEDAYFADIGSDHAYLPCYVCMLHPMVKAIAGEVREGPYERAIETVSHFQLQKRIEVRLGDGLAVIDEKVNEIVIAGMGGSLISKIISEGSNKLAQVKRIIVQPNNQTKCVRETLRRYQFSLSSETILEENNHIYEILVADRFHSDPYESSIMKKQMLFGPFLMKEKSPIFIKKWKNEYTKLLGIIREIQLSTNKNQRKLAYFKQQLQWVEEVIQ